MRYNMLVVLQGIIIYWIFTSASFLISLSRRHGMETNKVIFSIFFDCFLLLCFCALVVPLLYKYSELLKVFKNLSKFLAHPEIEWYCMSNSAVSWYFIGSPSRITFFLSFWLIPQLNVIMRHIVRGLSFYVGGMPFLEILTF